MVFARLKPHGKEIYSFTAVFREKHPVFRCKAVERREKISVIALSCGCCFHIWWGVFVFLLRRLCCLCVLRRASVLCTGKRRCSARLEATGRASRPFTSLWRCGESKTMDPLDLQWHTQYNTCYCDICTEITGHTNTGLTNIFKGDN